MKSIIDVLRFWVETALWTLLEKKVDSISSSFWSRTVLSCVIWVTNCMLATRGMLKVLRQTMVKHLTMFCSCSIFSLLKSP